MARNQHLIDRLIGIQAQLMAGYTGGHPMSNASKGREREEFIDLFLSKVMPATFRFGTGDITDANGKRSGQADVVVEFPFLPSLPMVGSTPRLYLSEGVAAVIEVKSDISTQWTEVENTARLIKALSRDMQSIMSLGEPGTQIPVFAIGYKGWKTIETLKEKVDQDLVDAILVVESGLFASNKNFRGVKANGPVGLWGLISCLHDAMTRVLAAHNDPLRYIL